MEKVAAAAAATGGMDADPDVARPDAMPDEPSGPPFDRRERHPA